MKLFNRDKHPNDINPVLKLQESYIKNPNFFDLWCAHPLNGQYKRLDFFLTLIKMVKPNVLIETGTYIGSSTMFFAQFIDKVYTIESQEKYFLISQQRFKKLNLLNVEGILGTSGTSIVEILKELPSNSNEILLAYLDAHWYKDIPTTLELEKLNHWGGPFVAMIDDFRVEDDPGYGFDQYDVIAVSKTLIPNLNNLFLYYPNIPSNLECGARRGLGIVLNDKAKKIIDPAFFEICRSYEI